MQQFDKILNQYESIEDFTIYLYNNQKSNRQFRDQTLMNLLLDFKSNVLKPDFLHSILSQRQQKKAIQTQLQKKVKIQEVISDKFERPLIMEYQLIEQIKSEQWVFDFAIDQRNKTFIAGMSQGQISIQDFQNGKIGAEIQSLKVHSNKVYCLYCMKNYCSFVMGNSDSSIIIMCLDQVNKWKVQETLNSHFDPVFCIIMNSKEDLLISGSNDGTVRFWKQESQAESWNLLQIVNAGRTYALSLNQSENKLIACSGNKQICIMIIQSNNEWKIFQKMHVKAQVHRICFTIQDQFIVQPTYSDYLKIYDYDESKQQFYKKTKVQVQSVLYCDNFFPCQFIKQLNILTVKHGEFVNIFRLTQNGEYQLIQYIEYQTQRVYGRMTDDGEYLITWDEGSKEIQIRELKFKEELS